MGIQQLSRCRRIRNSRWKAGIFLLKSNLNKTKGDKWYTGESQATLFLWEMMLSVYVCESTVHSYRVTVVN